MTPDPGGAAALEAELDALYGAPLAEFVERRDALAKRLRIAGAAGEARRVKALRKPTAVTWAINRLHLQGGGAAHLRAGAGALAPLTAASAALREALRDARTAEERRAAIDARRRALESATAAVIALLEEAGTSVGPALLRRVEGTLLAIAASAGGTGTPVPGRLDQELEAPGFDAILDSPGASLLSAPSPATRTSLAPAKTTRIAKGSSPANSAARAERVAPVKRGAPLESRAPAKEDAPARGAGASRRGAPPAAPPSSAERKYVPSRDRQREAALAVARRAVDDAEADLERATASAEAARARVGTAEKTLEKARREVEAARRELVAARTRLSERRRELDRIRR